VAGLDEDVAIPSDQTALGTSVSTPEQEGDRSRRCSSGFDDGIGERLPTPATMAAGLAVLDG
jgi:hypothetical protein